MSVVDNEISRTKTFVVNTNIQPCPERNPFTGIRILFREQHIKRYFHSNKFP